MSGTPPLDDTDVGEIDALAPVGAGEAMALFVDLDGTLIKSDLLWESVLLVLKHRPLTACKFPLWLLRGRAHLKRSVAAAVQLDVRKLPFRDDVIDFIREQAAQGQHVVLATAADAAHAQEIAAQLGCFDAVLASDGVHNLKGPGKLSAIEAYCSANGIARFAYVGDHRSDLPIWRQAAAAYVVEPAAEVESALRSIPKPTTVFGKRPSRVRALIKELRPQQWAKNALLFVPLIMAHQFTNTAAIVNALIAFVAFCCCASAVYVLNDLMDINEDRLHPRKCRRPFASAALPIAWGGPMIVGLLAVGLTAPAVLLPMPFFMALIVYLVTTTLYTHRLKNTLIADVLVLAGLYTLRVFAGGLATGIEVSQWLMALSLFLFVSLAFAKRYAELFRLCSEGAATTPGRAYQVADMRLIESTGPTSGYVAVLVLALYLNSDTMRQLYRSAWALWLICPLLLYWITRIWFLAVRGQMPEDPVLFAVKDRVSWLVLAGVCVLFLIGMYA